jgi:GTPase SAR1 family protein
VALPTEKNVPSEKMGDYSWLIYGTKKIGKSSLAAQFPNALFMMFEPGGKALRTYQADCSTWDKAKQYLTLLEKGKHAFETIVIDTGFEAYQKCFTYVCNNLGIEYPREDNFGKDWRQIENEFREFHNRIASLGLGLVVLCHESLKESQTRTGNKFDMVIPNLPKAADSFFRAIIDNVCWYHFRNHDRYLLIKGSDYAMAGTAVQADEHFLTIKGEPIYSVPMGTSAKEGFSNLAKAFKNQQADAFETDTNKFTEVAIRESVHQKLKKRK